MKKLKLNIQLFAATATITNARQGNYSIENNNEVQRLTFTVKRTSGSTYWSDKKTLTFRLTYTNDDGTTTTLTQTTQFNFPSGSVGATKSTYVDFTVPHKTDGTQNITYEASIATGTSVGTLHPTGSATLETIPRASSITVNDANIGSATNIVINKASSSFTTTLYYKASGQSNWTKIVDKTSNQVYGWTVPTSFYALIPNSKTIACQFYAETYSGSTLIGTSPTITATFTATGNPIINDISILDFNNVTTQLTGDHTKMIRYASLIEVVVDSTAQNSASVSLVKINGVDAINNRYYDFYNCSTNLFNIVVTDSRGYTTSQTQEITMVDYIPLTLNATIVRNQPTDGIVNINYNGNYFNGDFGAQLNSLTVQYRYVEKGQDINQATWQSLTPTISGNTYSQSNYQINGFNYQKQYEFQIRAIDRIRSPQINGINVSKGQPVFWWNDDGLYVNNILKLNNKNVALDDEKVEQLYLGNNPDINSLRETSGIYGIYNCSQAPTLDIGTLEVIRYANDWVLQRFTGIGNNIWNTWERIYYNGTTWSDWKYVSNLIFKKYDINFDVANASTGDFIFGHTNNTIPNINGYTVVGTIVTSVVYGDVNFATAHINGNYVYAMLRLGYRGSDTTINMSGYIIYVKNNSIDINSLI